MNLLRLIRKRDSASLATATPAIPATQAAPSINAVAEIANVAVAPPTKAQAVKPAIVAARDLPTHTASDTRLEAVSRKLQDDAELSYAMEAHDEIEPEKVILSLAIRGKGAVELWIPKTRYDAFALLEVLDKHAKQVTLQ